MLSEVARTIEQIETYNKGYDGHPSWTTNAIEIFALPFELPKNLHQVTSLLQLSKDGKYVIYHGNYDFAAEYQIIFDIYCRNVPKTVRNYIKGRGLHDLQVGYAPKHQIIRKLFNSHEWQARLFDMGVLKIGDYGIYDFFRERLIIAVRDMNQRIIGLIGRVLPESETQPKYLNTAFEKSKFLHIANFTGIFDTIYVAEGLFDAEMLAKVFNSDAACILGSAISKVQLQFLKQYKNVVFAFDGDDAGEKAMQSVEEMTEDTRYLKRVFCEIGRKTLGLTNYFYLELPKGKDPCSLGDELLRCELREL
jgi:DNA primase